MVEENRKTEADNRTTSKPPAAKKHIVREYAESIVIAVILALIIRTFVVQAFKIPSGSMEDTLAIGDHILVNKFIYGMKIPFTDKRILKIRDPKRGDVIVFVYPLDAEDKQMSSWNKKDFIKRVIGTPGDKVQVINKRLFVNGKPYDNPHEVHKDSMTIPACFPDTTSSVLRSNDQCRRDNYGPITVPANQYFVMGDNRDNSHDSRFWGFVRNDYIVGLAFIKYWSWDSNKHRIRFGNIGRVIN